MHAMGAFTDVHGFQINHVADHLKTLMDPIAAMEVGSGPDHTHIGDRQVDDHIFVPFNT